MFAIVAAIYVQVLPWSFGAIENLTTFVRADFISNFARPGAFNDLTLGFVFHYRERTPDGALRGVFMQDRRDPEHVSTYIAEAGKTVEKDGSNYLQLSKGVLLRPQAAGDSAMVRFDDYTIDLSQFSQALAAVKRPRERSTAELMSPSAKDRADPAMAGHIRSELLDRLASPLYALVAGLIAFAALGEARTTRQGRGLAIGGAILAFVAIRGLGIAATTLTIGVPAAAVFVWAIPIAADLRRAGDDLPPAAVFRAVPARRNESGMIGRTFSLYLAGPVHAHGARGVRLCLRADLRGRSRRDAAPLGRRAQGDCAADGAAVLSADSDGRRAGVAVRRAVRLDDRVPQPVAKVRTGRGAGRRRLGLADSRAARSRHPAARRPVGRSLQSRRRPG